MSLESLRAQIGPLGPSAVAVALCAARLAPVAFLCPLFGGQATPAAVRLALVLSLALFLHVEANVALTVPVETPLMLAALGVRELAYGTAMGLVTALPFDAARMGGRFIDLFRGTSAEASLPLVGTRESAAGDALFRLLVGLAVTGGLLPVILSGLLRGFEWVRLGAYVPTEGVVSRVVGLAGGAMATGLAVGAPVAAAVMAVDCLLGMVSRVAPQLPLQELGAPLRILGGGALLWLGVGILCERLLAGALSVEDVLYLLGEAAR